MRRLNCEEETWAWEQLGHAALGDSRRTARAVRMVARAAQSPGGKISEVFEDAAECQGAYDFLETRHVSVAALSSAFGAAAAERAARGLFAFAAVDGSSINLADRAKGKDFGSVGSFDHGARGLKVVSTLACSPDGVPLGLLSQAWWARMGTKSRSSAERRARNRKRRGEDKETWYWLEAIEGAAAHADQANAWLWFQLDREGDNQDILKKLAETTHRFTVRSSWNRLIDATGKDKQYLRQWLAREAPGGHYDLDIPAGPKRKARRAHIDVRWGRVVFRLHDRLAKTVTRLEVMAVWAREEGTCPASEKPVNWLLLTNATVESFEDACLVVHGYTQRWRVEEFHKTWKSGACKVEESQLRSQQAVTLWATMLAAVAARIERIKYLARSSPEQPATIELSEHEIRALILLMRGINKRTETIPDTTPTIGQATEWIARLGGYTGKSSGGPPGSITIRRGLEKVRPGARVLAALEAETRSDQ